MLFTILTFALLLAHCYLSFLSFCFIFQTLGKVGRVQQIYHDNDLKVRLLQWNYIDLCPAMYLPLKIHSMLLGMIQINLTLIGNCYHVVGGDLWNIMDLQSNPCD